VGKDQADEALGMIKGKAEHILAINS